MVLGYFPVDAAGQALGADAWLRRNVASVKGRSGPWRPVASHPNLVTTFGLNALNKAMAEARAAYNVAQQIEGVNECRRAAAPAIREMNYFAERLSIAQVIPPPTPLDSRP